MKRSLLTRLFALLLVFAFPASMFAADARGAMVYATNGVAINGATIQRSGTVLAGDKVEVPAQSAAAITAPGSQVVLSAGSKAVYTPQSISLGESSGVEVRTEKGLAVKVDSMTITPAAKSAAKFQVARGGGEVLIAVNSGSVDVFDGKSNSTVAAGETRTVPDPAPQHPGATPGATAGGAAGGLSTAVAVGIGIAVAAVAAVIGVETSKPPSSSRP